MPSGDEDLGAEAEEWLIDFSAGVMWARQVRGRSNVYVRATTAVYRTV